jgi:hypothetical protein
LTSNVTPGHRDQPAELHSLIYVAIERGRVVFADHAANVTDREVLLRRVAV